MKKSPKIEYFRRPQIEVDHDSEILFQIFRKKYNVTKDQIKGHYRFFRFVYLRNAFIYIMREHFKHNFDQIGEVLNNRDHSTILHARNNVKNLFEYDFTKSPTFKNLNLPKENYKQLISNILQNYEEIEKDFKEVEILFI